LKLSLSRKPLWLPVPGLPPVMWRATGNIAENSTDPAKKYWSITILARWCTKNFTWLKVYCISLQIFSFLSLPATTWVVNFCFQQIFHLALEIRCEWATQCHRMLARPLGFVCMLLISYKFSYTKLWFIDFLVREKWCLQPIILHNTLFIQ